MLAHTHQLRKGCLGEGCYKVARALELCADLRIAIATRYHSLFVVKWLKLTNKLVRLLLAQYHSP